MFGFASFQVAYTGSSRLAILPISMVLRDKETVQKSITTYVIAGSFLKII